MVRVPSHGRVYGHLHTTDRSHGIASRTCLAEGSPVATVGRNVGSVEFAAVGVTVGTAEGFGVGTFDGVRDGA